MPTNIVRAQSQPVGTSIFETLGDGAQGLAGIIGAAMSANAANKAKRAAPTGFGEGSSFGPASPASPSTFQAPGSVTPIDAPLTRTPWSGGSDAGSGNLGVRPIDGMVQPFNSYSSGDYLGVGPSTQPSNLMGSLNSSPIAKTISPFQTMMTRNFPASTFQYGGM